jgi:hypothetical protein
MYLPYRVHVVGIAEWHRHFTKGVRMGRHTVVLIVWVASCTPNGYHTTVTICATVSLSPTPRPTLTKRLSELYPGGGFRLNTESEKKFLFPVRTIAVTRHKRSYYWFCVDHLCSASTKLVGIFCGLGDVFVVDFEFCHSEAVTQLIQSAGRAIQRFYAHTVHTNVGAARGFPLSTHGFPYY